MVDFETIEAAEPEYDLRTFPGPGMELLTAVMRHYQQVTGWQLSANRVMAWHLRNALGDALWPSEAGMWASHIDLSLRVSRADAGFVPISVPVRHPVSAERWPEQPAARICLQSRVP